MANSLIETVGILVFNSDKTKVLLVENIEKSEHVTHVFGLPAGRINQDETAHQAAIRELNEETGLSSTTNNMHLLPFEYSADIPAKDGSIRHLHMTTFLCKMANGDLINNDETKPVWVNIAELDKITLLPNIVDVVQKTIEYLK